MYLAYCEAGFAERRIGVMQMTLAKPGWRQPAGPTSAYEAPQALAS
jgi:cyclopropane-fatty-acyl-phospholipid synthase